MVHWMKTEYHCITVRLDHGTVDMYENAFVLIKFMLKYLGVRGMVPAINFQVVQKK
jgi:hypothetical protein